MRRVGPAPHDIRIDGHFSSHEPKGSLTTSSSSDRGEALVQVSFESTSNSFPIIQVSPITHERCKVSLYTPPLNTMRKCYFVEFHVIPKLRVHGLSWDETLKFSGWDPSDMIPG